MRKIRKNEQIIRMKQIRTSVFIMLISTGILVGCGGSSSSAGNYDSALSTDVKTEDIYMNEEAGEAAPAAVSPDGTTPESTNIETNRKLIKNVDMNVETEEFDKLLGTVEERITKLGGYVESLNSNSNEAGDSFKNRTAEIKARIPVEQLDAFVTLVDEMSNITSRNEYVDDVTMQYVDLESHKKTLLAEQESLLRLLEKAETMEDIIKIEARLSDVRYQLESMETQLRTYDNLISYSTVQIYISEVERLTPVLEKGSWDRIKTGFTENMYRVGKGFQNFAIEFVISLPFIFLLAILALIAFIIVRIILKTTEAHAAKVQLKRESAVPYQKLPQYGSQPPQSPVPAPYTGVPQQNNSQQNNSQQNNSQQNNSQQNNSQQNNSQQNNSQQNNSK